MSSGQPAPSQVPAPGAGTTPTDESHPRATPPIRWPKPQAGQLPPVALWFGGVALATVVPGLITPPTAENVEVGSVLLSLAFTLAGVVVMLVAAYLVWRRGRDSTALLIGAVPAFAVLLGGAILAATLMAGSAAS